ncbi:MAG: hypothetical protein GF344_05940 [Chitinivibrionales bacterium]|nr:hypothetical protein [Chitinivibrionales bacterium]
MSNQSEYIALLQETVKELKQARHWLQRSVDKCRDIDIASRLSEDQYDDLEAYMSRFVRANDLLIQKVFRAIDAVELERPGTLIDAVNRAHKRALIPGVDDIRRLRETRNEIAHEYVTEDLTDLLDRVRGYTPMLISIIDQTIAYCGKYVGE